MVRHLKMLCVDDKEELRDALAQQFINEDFDVDTAEDGDWVSRKLLIISTILSSSISRCPEWMA